MVIQSCVTHHRKLMKQEGTSTILPHIVTSNLEHGSVLKTAQNLADDGIIGDYTQPNLLEYILLCFK